MSIGLSCKTQELYLLVFCIRYLDLFMYFISLYNTFMKIFFISSTAFIIYLMRYKKPFCTVSTLTHEFRKVIPIANLIRLNRPTTQSAMTSPT